ncbi:hypothetical protein GCM10027174_13170 [Salinifilum aidingensis]
MTEPRGETARSTGRPRFDRKHAWTRFVGVLSTLVRVVGSVFAALLALHVVLVLGGANPDHAVTRFVASCADPLALGLQNLFTPADPQLAVLLNYGIAALFWLLITSIALRILRSLA